MRRFFAKNLLFVISVNLLVKPLWIFLIDRTVQNTVGPASYGLYQALLNLGLIFQILLDFGINNYNSKTLAQFPGKLKTLFPAMLSARLVLSLLYLVIVCGIGILIGYNAYQLVLLLCILLIQTMSSLMLFIRSNMSGLHLFKIDAVLSIADRFLMIFICGFLLFYPPLAKNFKIEWFIITQIFSYTAAAVIGIIILRKIAKIRFHLSFNYKKVWSIIQKSLPYALLIFLMSIYTRADTMLVERLSGANGSEQAGIYWHGYRLLDVGNMFGIMFASMLLPIFGRMLAQRQNTFPIVQLCVNILLPTSFLVTVTGALFSVEIMNLLYKHVTAYDASVFTWLMMAFPAFSLSNVYSTLLTAKGDLKLLNKIALTGVIINLGLNFWLIPQYQALGAAFAACATQSVLAICFMIFAHKKANLPSDSKWLLSFLIFLFSIITAGYGIRLLPISWMIQLPILFSIGIVMIILFRFVSLAAVKALVSRN